MDQCAIRNAENGTTVCVGIAWVPSVLNPDGSGAACYLKHSMPIGENIWPWEVDSAKLLNNSSPSSTTTTTAVRHADSLINMCKAPTTLKTAPTAGSDENLKPAVIAGIVIGSVAGVALIIVGIVFLVRRKLKPKREPQDQNHVYQVPQNQTG
jgi:hypothetical protein